LPTATHAPPRERISLAPLPDLEDADLVRRVRGGDERAFEEIVKRYRAPLMRYSARLVGPDLAEDIVQHAFANAATHLRDDPRPIHLRAWLYRVAHNAALNMRARKDWGHEELSADIDGVLQPPELAAQRSAVRSVVSEVGELPARQREALVMSVFEGLGYDEIATRLKTSPNSVRALLSRARVHLRDAAAALAPLPLLQSLLSKGAGAVGLTGGQGALAAGGTAVQAKLVAVATTTVLAGAATAEHATSEPKTPAAPAVVAPAPSPSPPLAAAVTPPAALATGDSEATETAKRKAKEIRRSRVRAETPAPVESPQEPEAPPVPEAPPAPEAPAPEPQVEPPPAPPDPAPAPTEPPRAEYVPPPPNGNQPPPGEDPPGGYVPTEPLEAAGQTQAPA